MTLDISQGNSATFTVDDADSDATNELITSTMLMGTMLRITDAGGETDVDLSSLGAGTQDLREVLNISNDANNLFRIRNILDPTNDQDVATKNYVDNIPVNISWDAFQRVLFVNS